MNVDINATNSKHLTDSAASSLSTSQTTPSSALTPSVGTPPADVVSIYGSTATFTATVSSSDAGELTYQWQRSTNSGVSYLNVSSGSGATSLSYTTPSLVMSDNNNEYRLVVTNSINGTTSITNSIGATLTVNKSPQSALSIRYISGTFGTPLTLVTSGGSSSGAVTYSATNGSATGCTESAGVLSVTSSGTCLVVATMAGGDNYTDVSSATSPATTITFASATQTITFASLSSKSYADADFNISASASSSLTVAFTSSNSAICTVTGTSVSLKSGGTCTIYADQAGSADYTAAARVTQSFSIAALALTEPSAPSATAVSITSISVTFSVVSHASSYTARVYLVSSGALVGSAHTNFTSGASITSLESSTAYKLTITAIGDGTNYSSSTESSDSEIVTTLTPAGGVTINTHPAGPVSAAVGTSATFTVSATSNGVLSYQWQVKAGVSASWASVAGGSGATTNSYTTASVTTTNNGYQYRVHIVNTLSGTTTNATSNAATLSVAARSGVTTFTPIFTLGIASQTYMVATQISAATGMAGKVAFSASGRPIPGCTAVRTVANVATCSWRPSTMGNVVIAATFTPTDAGYAVLNKTLSIKVAPK